MQAVAVAATGPDADSANPTHSSRHRRTHAEEDDDDNGAALLLQLLRLDLDQSLIFSFMKSTSTSATKGQLEGMIARVKVGTTSWQLLALWFDGVSC